VASITEDITTSFAKAKFPCVYVSVYIWKNQRHCGLDTSI